MRCQQTAPHAPRTATRGGHRRKHAREHVSRKNEALAFQFAYGRADEVTPAAKRSLSSS